MIKSGDIVIDVDFECPLRMTVIKSTDSTIIAREGSGLYIRYRPKDFKYLKLIERPESIFTAESALQSGDKEK
jgi:hypothetical protein